MNILSPPFDASELDAKFTPLKKRWPDVRGLPVVTSELVRRLGLAGACRDKFAMPKYCGTVNQAAGGSPGGRPTNLVDAEDDPTNTSKGRATTPLVSTKIPAGTVIRAISLA